MFVYRTAGRLQDEYIRATNIFLNLYIRFAIFEARHQGLVPGQPKKLTDIVCQLHIGGAAEYLELVIYPHPLRLALGLFFGTHVRLFLRRRR